jgi:dTDP-4-dehydrorhamnose reductase
MERGSKRIHNSRDPKYAKILLTGGTGQVGRELQSTLRSLGNIWTPSRGEFDLAKPQSLRDKVQSFRPDLIINSAAFTDVDKIEEETALAHAVNGEAPKVLAEEAHKLNIPLIHYSTDYVFDGVKAEPYTEDDIPNPINVYGETKLAGERALQATHDRYLILRTSWVFSNKGRNFLTTMLRLFQEREEISVVEDQLGAPTSALFLAEATAQILGHLRAKDESEDRWGLYHLTPSGRTSWHGFAQEILKRAIEHKQLCNQLMIKEIRPIPTAAYPTPARRPKNSSLDTTKLVREFQIELPKWEKGLL